MSLKLILIILFVSIIVLWLTPSYKVNHIRSIGLLCSGIVFLLSILLLYYFKLHRIYFQGLTISSFGAEDLNFYFSIGLDSISIFFFALSSLLIFLCILFSWDTQFLKEHTLFLIFLELMLLIVFATTDILVFYLLFEATLIPMYSIIGIWGSRQRKIRAAMLFFIYTLIGSYCMLIALLYIYNSVGTLDYRSVLSHNFSVYEQYFLWLGFFITFSTKIPLFPFHIWLPEAHVEAPTVGSVLLAGVLLKLGVYGFLRFNIILFPSISFFFTPFIYVLSILGIFFASLSALGQTDFKRIIAYSSIAHMSLITMGVFSFTFFGVDGAIFQSVSHGFVSGALFLLIGILYKRYHSRVISYFTGLTHTMPLFSLFFFLFTLANIALPGTSSFIGEIMLLLGVFYTNTLVGCFSAVAVILSGAYSLWLYNRICFGNLSTYSTRFFQDLNLSEFIILFFLLFLVLFLGLLPSSFFNYLSLSSIKYILICFK